MTDDPRSLRNELHDLASDVASSSGAAARARDRAQRGIVRHRRNQRAAVAGLATVVLIGGVSAAFALGHDSRHSAPPAHETTVAPATTTTTTILPTTTSTVPPFVNRSPYSVPAVDQVPLAAAAYTHSFAWGRGAGQVSFAVKGGEGASGGPAAFSADDVGNQILFDHSNARILVVAQDGPPAARTVDMPSPAVTAAVFDAHSRVIAAFYNDLVVFDANNGSTLGSFAGAGPSGAEITRLVVVGSTVSSVAEDGTLTAELHDSGSGYARASSNAPLDPGAVTLTFHRAPSTLDVVVAGSGRHYTFSGTDAGSIADVPAAQVLRDGSLVVVLGSMRTLTYDPDHSRPYVIARVDRSGRATYARVDASAGYLTNGPAFVVDDRGVAVMSSTTTAGVSVSYFTDADLFG